MAERYISIDNVVGSGKNGKVMLSDLDLGQDDMARFAGLLTSYIKSGDFAADLTSPDWFSSGPSNYNIIPYMDSFENYIDKEILGPDTGITVRGTNLRAYNGYVSAQVDCSSADAYKYLHSDTNTSAAWITVGTGTTLTTKYYFSGYFWFIGAGNGATLQIIKHNIGESESVVGSIIIDSAKVDSAINKWTRFSSDPIILAEEDLITFKLIVNDANTHFYIDALQLEIVVDGQEIQPFIQSGVVITDGSNIKVNSLAANAIKAYSITTSKLDSGVGNELVISGNTSIVAPREISNLIPFTIDAYTSAHFEQGTIDNTGVNTNSTTYLRTQIPDINKYGNGLAIASNTDYIIRLSPLLINSYSKVFLYNGIPSAGTFLTSYSIVNNQQYFNSGAATYARIILAKDSLGAFTPEELIEYYAIMEPVSAYLSGAKYRFDGSAATFQNAGLIIKNSSNQSAFTADSYGVTLYNKDGVAKIYATSDGLLHINGTLEAVDGKFSGKLEGGSIEVGTVGSANVVRADGINGLWAGASTYASAPFKVNLSGAIASTSGYIGGWAISNGVLTSTNGKIKLDSAGNRIYLNNSAYFDAGPLSSDITVSGSLTSDGSIKGSSLKVTDGLLIYGNNISSSIILAGQTAPVTMTYGAEHYPILCTASPANEYTRGGIKIKYDSTDNILDIWN